MGYGDDIMATARARVLYEINPVMVEVVNVKGQRYPSEVYSHNPIIATLLHRGPVQTLYDGSHCRPYVDYDKMLETSPTDSIKQATHWVWIPDKMAGPGEIFFAPHEEPRLVDGDYVVIEPHIKPKASPNKDWGFFHYQQVVAALPGVRFVQCDYGLPILDGVDTVKTPTFRDALRLIRDAGGLVSPEGGMHHAAAALGVPAVVLFGGFLSPDVTGYEGHANLAALDAGCGARYDCAHCNQAWLDITVTDVVATIQETIL